MDNLGAADLELPAHALEQLSTAAPHEPGFPTDFISETSAWVLGAAAL